MDNFPWELINPYCDEVDEKNIGVFFKDPKFLELNTTVLNAIYYRIRKNPDLTKLPQNIVSELSQIYHRNLARNTLLRQNLLDILGQFNANGLQCIVLKGGISLFQSIYPTNAIRYMGDIDLLVDSNDFEKAKSLLNKNNYFLKDDGSFYNDDTILFIDLHSSKNRQYKNKKIDIDQFIKKAQVISVDGVDVRIPSHIDQLWYYFYHSFYRHSYLAEPDNPEVLLELISYIKSYEGLIDFNELIQRAFHSKCELVFAIVVYLLDERFSTSLLDDRLHDPNLALFLSWIKYSKQINKKYHYALSRYNQINITRPGLFRKFVQTIKVLIITPVLFEKKEFILSFYKVKNSRLLPLLKTIHIFRLFFLNCFIWFKWIIFYLKKH
ncbi:MAG: nucleotidyltransferase family protein [Pseudomonadota bacterium]